MAYGVPQLLRVGHAFCVRRPVHAKFVHIVKNRHVVRHAASLERSPVNALWLKRGQTARSVASSHSYHAAFCTHSIEDLSLARTLDEQNERLVSHSGEKRISFVCPACGQRIHRIHTLQKHFQTCCPDLISARAWKQSHDDRQAIASLIDAAAQSELRVRQACIDTAFREVDAEGQQIKRTTEQVAAILQLPTKRVRQAFRMAQKAMPLPPDPEPVEVIYEDDDVVAVNKPPGVISAPKHRYKTHTLAECFMVLMCLGGTGTKNNSAKKRSAKGGSMVNRLITYLGYPPYPVHRLDMMTSGVLLMAKTSSAASFVGQQFGNRTVSKAYVAIATGCPSGATFSVSSPIGRHPTQKVARVAAADGDAAHTNFTILTANPEADLRDYTPGLVATPDMYKARGAALIMAKPVTGRTHQIRVHLADAGHAILGDEVYGLQGTCMSRQALHAATLAIQHPTTKQLLRLTANLPEDMVHALEMLKVDCPGPEDLRRRLAHAA